MPLSVFALLVVVTSFFLSSQTPASLLTSTGSTIELGGIPYYVPSKPFASVPSSFYTPALADGKSMGTPWIPVTLVKAAATFGTTELQSTLKTFGDIDDVWTTGFLSVVLISGETSYNSNISTIFSGANAPSAVLSLPHGVGSEIPPGPYLISSVGDLYQPHRLYSDTQGAFTQPLISSTTVEGTYIALPATVPGIASPGIAVPSRLYYVKTPDKPLAGVRTGIKDIYDIAGVGTSDGNRAFYRLYPPRNATALVVQRLIDAGAVLVGKMKTSQFANGEIATADWVDYHEPFNPRGDGYQDTSSSSSGSGSGAASYPWLDLTLGSDTGGSIRGPGQVQGVYGNRPTYGLVPLTGAMPLAPQLDTAGFLCRDPAIWTAAARAIYEGLPFYDQYPKRLQTIGFPTSETIAANAVVAQSNTILLAFLAKIEAFLGTTATALNYTALWEQTKPDSNLPSLSILLNRTYPTLISKEQTKNVRDPFYADYAAVYDGRLPFVDPVPLVRWKFGDSLPASELDVAVNNKTIFKNWWEMHVLPPAVNDSATCSENLILYSSGVNIVYRNIYLDPPTPPFGYDDSQISIFAEVPDFVVPLGVAAYNSTVTNHTEVLPVSVDIIAARGCDGLIFNLVEALLAAGIVSIPQAGQTASGGEILSR